MDPAGPAANTPYFLGIDLGTSGVRASIIDSAGLELAYSTVPLPPPSHFDCRSEQPALPWWQAVHTLLLQQAAQIDLARIAALAIDGTSGTVLLTDEQNLPLGNALMYNDARASKPAARLATLAPAASPARSVTGGLAKLLWLLEYTPPDRIAHLAHQADWITARLTGLVGHSDVNNCLKTGFDPLQRQWPGWMSQLDLPAALLPQVHNPGDVIASIDHDIAKQFGFLPNTLVCAGTTDSHAAVLATGVQHPGEAVTSLGSTLVVKIVSDSPIFAARYGIYSQPFGEYWLVGGASNSGGAVLKQFFTDEQIHTLTAQLDPDHLTGLDYYPLIHHGERFPIADPTFAPRLTPRPNEDVKFLQGLLEGIARIEHQGYQRLAELGAPMPVSIRTVGGGARNHAWTRIRERLLKVPMITPPHTEAAYGAAMLARQGFKCGLV
jgi:D-ribulokinase